MLFSSNQKFIALQQNFLKDEADTAIATSNVLLSLSQRLKTPIVHFWTLEDTVILGHMDTKLKSLKKGLKVIEAANYNYFFRNAGGLGVVSDEGIVNVGFYFPTAHDVAIDSAYQQVAEFLQSVFNDLDVQVKTGEISDSYCPGKFDLSIAGQKIAGIAQRRAKGGISILLYLSLNGDQEKRGQLMEQFYQAANVPSHPKIVFPEVNPKLMINFDDRIKVPIGAHNFDEMVTNQLIKLGNQVKILNPKDLFDLEFKSELFMDMEAIKARKAEIIDEN